MQLATTALSDVCHWGEKGFPELVATLVEYFHLGKHT